MAKGYWVNSQAKTITEVSYHSLEDMRKFIGGWLECAHIHSNGDTLYVDEEGLRKAPQTWFHYKHRPDQVLAGNALLVGRELEGDEYENGYITLDPTMSLQEFRRKVQF